MYNLFCDHDQNPALDGDLLVDLFLICTGVGILGF
jgi:hypothetical protein